MPNLPDNLTDWLFASILGRNPFYKDGWGDHSLIDDLRTHFDDVGPPPAIEVQWVRRNKTIREGFFETPVKHYPLPPEARTAYFQMLLPGPEDAKHKAPMCLYLAATADEGYYYRRFVAGPLIRRGIGAIILENPYYGRRKPRGSSFAPRKFADQLMMNLATLEEARALLKWLSDDGYEVLGVSGYSMGGFMAAYIAALTDFPLAAVPSGAGNNAARVFTQSYFEKVPDWEALAAEMNEPDNVRDRFIQVVEMFTVDRLPKPVDPESAIIVATEKDAIVPLAEAQALHAHWEGSHFRLVDAGHVSGFMKRLKAIREATYDAFSIRIAKDH